MSCRHFDLKAIYNKGIFVDLAFSIRALSDKRHFLQKALQSMDIFSMYLSMDPWMSPVAHVLLQHMYTNTKVLTTAAVVPIVAGIDVYQVRRTSTQIVSQEFPMLHGYTTLNLAIIKPPGPDSQVNMYSCCNLVRPIFVFL